MRGRWLAWLGVLGVGVAGAYGVACVSNSDEPVNPCPKYCSDMLATCTGNDTQYPDDPTCERFCSSMAPGEAGIAAGDTVACRGVAVSNAKDEPSPSLKHQDCVGGGPAAGQCVNNDPCTAFCTLDLALCGSQRTGYTDVNACVTACETWGQSFDGALLGSTGNTLQCRTYHLELSQTGDPNDLETHCPHTGVVSARCFDSDAGSDAGSDAASDASSD